MIDDGIEDTFEKSNVDHNTSKRGMIFFIYFFFGPPLGAIIFMSAGFIMMLYDVVLGPAGGSGTDFVQALSGFLAITLFAVIYSYLVGGAQAALTGVTIACFSGKEGRFGYGLAFTAPVIIGVIAGIILTSLMGSPYQIAILLGVVGVLASLSVRFLFRKRFRRENLTNMLNRSNQHETNSAI